MFSITKDFSKEQGLDKMKKKKQEKQKNKDILWV